ncbi:hypothetical protein CRV09_00690 [Candidatus Pantoea edessiphila]|uniref:4Fe-4S ferredoxin-type domain-containing protein n=1 Tax=Candidatus Pantoea edessiphila TaxID=2044610 RepID=A0A2P5T2J8_9GAMM|nr:RnfABCDGE type electron transport complex subunit B [Candidatus Pantoea edessiphila]PPI88815.1 hypothetical protein CRV09_00690 [Candidatus Pantoea edessiphila]
MLEIAKMLNIEPKLIRHSNKIILKKIAYIEENKCIGCNKCVKTCPAGAIVGAVRNIHTVISNYCTCCNLCIDYCPVNCIKLISVNITINHIEWDVDHIPIKLDLICNCNF